VATLPLFQIMIERALKLLERDVFALIDFFA